MEKHPETDVSEIAVPSDCEQWHFVRLGLSVYDPSSPERIKCALKNAPKGKLPHDFVPDSVKFEGYVDDKTPVFSFLTTRRVRPGLRERVYGRLVAAADSGEGHTLRLSARNPLAPH